jgi:hypothetical protein
VQKTDSSQHHQTEPSDDKTRSENVAPGNRKNPFFGGALSARHREPFFLRLLLARALTIPFFFESPSMWHPFGVDKAILRTGKILGYSLTEGSVL